MLAPWKKSYDKPTEQLKKRDITCLQRSEWKKESEVAQLCPTLCNPMDCSLPGFSVHGIF